MISDRKSTKPQRGYLSHKWKEIFFETFIKSIAQ